LAFELLAVDPHGRQKPALARPHGAIGGPPLRHLVLDCCDLVAARGDRRGGCGCAGRQRVEAHGGLSRVVSPSAHGVDHACIVRGDPAQKLRTLQQVREPLRLEHHAHQVRAIRLVPLDESRREGRSRLAQADAQAREARALGAEPLLDAVELRPPDVELALEPKLAALKSCDVAVNGPDAVCVSRHVGRQHALAALAALDLRTSLVDLAPQRLGARRGGRDDWHDGRQRQRHLPWRRARGGEGGASGRHARRRGATHRNFTYTP